jgi:LysR family hydrogen peroxide-inducible transcriptional activator
MTLRDLEYLVTVADLRHFGKAAEVCHVSQPTLSMQLRKLEDELGVALFERTNKHVLVTDVGERVVEEARAMLRQAGTILEIAKTARDPFAGDLKLGAFPTLAPYLLPMVVPKVAAAFPNLKLLLLEEKTDALVRKVVEGGVDAALLALPTSDDRLESVALFEDRFRLAVPESHELAKRTAISRVDLKNQRLLLLEEGHCLRHQALELCSTLGSSEYEGFRATSLETLRQMVAAGVGITVVPEIAIGVDRRGVRYIPFDGQPPSRTIGMIWRKTSPRTEALRAIAALIKKEMKAR